MNPDQPTRSSPRRTSGTAFVKDRAGTIAASGLDAGEREALAANGFDRLVEMGAHPLLALSRLAGREEPTRRSGLTGPPSLPCHVPALAAELPTGSD